MLEFLNTDGGIVKRFYENLDTAMKIPYYDTAE
jgi:hypothetical protein